MNIYEQLNSKYGWSSGRKFQQGAPKQGLRRSGMNTDVLAWVPGQTGGAIRNDADGIWFFRVLDMGGMGATWQRCRYFGAIIPKFKDVDEAIVWATSKQFTGLNITDRI